MKYLDGVMAVILFFTWIILFGGDPDIADGIIYWLTGGDIGAPE